MQTKTLFLALFTAAAASAANINGARQNGNNGNTNPANGNTNNNNQNNNNNGAASPDFGSCTPTMSFQFGRSGRASDVGTFLPTDATIAKNQQDAVSPNGIMTRICDQLSGACGANDAAVAACQAALKSTEALGTKDASTATAFNSALGF
ncbi:hypothetical protein F4859DRAFT_516934 [Xylaria cf. heliscus]|nr:hypothetical protein F4859DRAFT_516934 [Xylaria cf. heliscus]